MILTMPTFSSMDQVQHSVLSALLEEGTEVAPRGLHTREIEAAQFQLENPRARCVGNPDRRWSFPVALGEFAWHVAGGRDLGHLTYYLPRWAEFSDDQQSIRGSCYGWRIFRPRGSAGSQWDRLCSLLRADLHSRRAVLTLHSPTRLLDAGIKDSPCALALQFLIRNGRVDAFGLMRSNDAIWGLPYDVFLFTMLQELLAAQLGLELGTYTHVACSMHLYDRHVALAQRIVRRPTVESAPMEPMDRPDQLPLFLAYEARLRNGTGPDLGKVSLSRYWRGLIDELESFAEARTPALDH